MKPEIGRTVLLEWVDIHTDAGWSKPNDTPGLARCKTIGFVAHVDDSSVTVAGCVGIAAGGEAESNMRMCIPWGCVTSWAYVRAGQRHKGGSP